LAAALNLTMTDRRNDKDTPDDFSGTFASPACYMHELDPFYAGLASDPQATIDVARWRKAERERLIAARLALSIEEREASARAIAEQLDQILTLGDETVVSVYWPFRGEPDLRFWMRGVHERGARVALPAVVAKGQPLQFRLWTPETRMERGVWNILVPPPGTEIEPTVTIAPLVGFDGECYRLGYGGGYYDQTLATLSKKPLTIGVGHPMERLATIYPQPHDIPMDWIVTGDEPPRKRSDVKTSPA
jgi:5,10-methenyltetrahydrofolate synthetase